MKSKGALRLTVEDIFYFRKSQADSMNLVKLYRIHKELALLQKNLEQALVDCQETCKNNPSIQAFWEGAKRSLPDSLLSYSHSSKRKQILQLQSDLEDYVKGATSPFKHYNLPSIHQQISVCHLLLKKMQKSLDKILPQPQSPKKHDNIPLLIPTINKQIIYTKWAELKEGDEVVNLDAEALMQKLAALFTYMETLSYHINALTNQSQRSLNDAELKTGSIPTHLPSLFIHTVHNDHQEELITLLKEECTCELLNYGDSLIAAISGRADASTSEKIEKEYIQHKNAFEKSIKKARLTGASLEESIDLGQQNQTLQKLYDEANAIHSNVRKIRQKGFPLVHSSGQFNEETIDAFIENGFRKLELFTLSLQQFMQDTVQGSFIHEYLELFYAHVSILENKGQEIKRKYTLVKEGYRYCFEVTQLFNRIEQQAFIPEEKYHLVHALKHLTIEHHFTEDFRQIINQKYLEMYTKHDVLIRNLCHQDRITLQEQAIALEDNFSQWKYFSDHLFFIEKYLPDESVELHDLLNHVHKQTQDVLLEFSSSLLRSFLYTGKPPLFLVPLKTFIVARLKTVHREYSKTLMNDYRSLIKRCENLQHELDGEDSKSNKLQRAYKSLKLFRENLRILFSLAPQLQPKKRVWYSLKPTKWESLEAKATKNLQQLETLIS